MKLKPNFFLTADTHFGHDKLLEYQGRPKGVDEIIVKEWNNLISKDDSVLHLGDLALTNKIDTKGFTDRLNGKKFLVRGNHDGHSETWYRDCGFTTVEPIYKGFKDKYDKRYHVLFTHEPVADVKWLKKWFNIHGHLHGDKHRGIETTDRHFDVGVDVHDYKPVRLYDILKGFW